MARGVGDSDFTNVNVVTSYKVAGTQEAAIANADPAGDTMNNILVVLRAHGLIAT